jgi:VWFA-related protein
MANRIGLALVVGCSTVLAAALSAQQAPVFRSGVDLVTIDVTVVGEAGRPVENLTADQFELRVDGIARRIVRAVYVPHKPAVPRTAERAPLDFTSNEDAEAGRLILIAVDQQHIRRVEGLAALRAAATFVDELEPADRVAAAPLSHTGAIEFTNQHARVKEYLQGLTGTASTLRGQFNLGLIESLAIAEGQRTWLDRAVSRECGQPLSRFESQARIAEANGMRDPCPVQVEQEGRAYAQEARTNARTTLNLLTGLMARLADIDGPKTLVFVSEGLVAEPQLIDLTSLGAAAQAARVTIYVLQLETPMFDASESAVSPTLQQDVEVRGDGLARLAGSARGAQFRLVGADPYPFRRILRELSGYYLLAFEAAEADRDGRARRIDVSARAPGVTVRTRPVFRNTAARAKDAEAQLVRLLRNPRLATELPVRATSYTFREPDGRMRVIVSAEADSGGGSDLTLGYVLIDQAGLIAASGTAAAPDGRFIHVATVPAGRYILRAAALEPAGRQGSVERRFDATLHIAGSLGISDLMLTDGSASDALRPIVSRPPGNRLAAVVEIYGAAGWKPTELPATIEIKSADGRTALGPIKSAAASLGASSARLRADLAVGDLPPGTYTVLAHLTLPNGTTQVVERKFLK